MGTRRKTYGDSCASARNVARHGVALQAARDEFDSHPNGEEWLVEMFVAALHEMPARALRDIADAVDPALPED